MLRTPDDVILALRARKADLQLSNATVEEIAGLTGGGLDKALGPARTRTPILDTLMAIVGALGCGMELVVDPESKVPHRWERRQEMRVHDNHRISREAAIKLAWSDVLGKAARRAAKARWKNSTPEQRQAHIAMMNTARALARKSNEKGRDAMISASAAAIGELLTVGLMPQPSEQLPADHNTGP